MMKFGKIVAAAAIASLVGMGPAMAAGAVRASATGISTPAGKLAALRGARSGASMKEENKLSGGGTILAVVAAAAVIAGIVVAVDGGNDNEGPVSN